MQRVLNNEGCTEKFTPAEIVSGIVNLLDAKRNLSQEEYFFVSVVFEVYSRDKQKRILSRSGFLALCNEIIAHIDLIAPYYKVCGDRRMEFLSLEESGKYEYRQRAWWLLRQRGIFGEEWMSLHREFSERFCIDS